MFAVALVAQVISFCTGPHLVFTLFQFVYVKVPRDDMLQILLLTARKCRGGAPTAEVGHLCQNTAIPRLFPLDARTSCYIVCGEQSSVTAVISIIIPDPGKTFAAVILFLI